MTLGPDEFTGERLGSYQVLCRLAVGGMAELFLARDERGTEPVVLKRLLADQREDASSVQLLLDEARVTAALDHPNVARVLDLFEDRGEVVLVVEYIDGVTLEELLGAYRKLGQKVPLGLALTLGQGVARGLEHAHGQRDGAGRPRPVVHRDLTPRNVMVEFSGVVRVLDFGIARAMGAARRTQVGMVRGTTASMSPEQASGREVDPRSDLFSLGILLHELLTGRPLFARPTPAEEMAAVCEGPIPRPGQANPNVPRVVDELVMGLLQRPLETRTASARAFLDRLAAAASATLWSPERVAAAVRGLLGEREGAAGRLLGGAAKARPTRREVVALPGGVRPRAPRLFAEVEDDELPTRLARTSSLPGSPRPVPAHQRVTEPRELDLPVAAPARPGRWALVAALGSLAVAGLGLAWWSLLSR